MRRWQRLMALVGRSRGAQVWKMSRYMAERGVPIAQPMGFFMERTGLFQIKSRLCSRSLSQCKNLAEVGRDDKALLKHIIEIGLLARIIQGIADLHTVGISHGDLKWSNILIDEGGSRYWFVDLDNARQRRWLKDRYFIQRDLVRFIVSAIESGLNREAVDRLVQHYATLRGLALTHVQTAMATRLRKLLLKKGLTLNANNG